MNREEHAVKKVTVYGIGEIKKHVFKQKVTLQYMKECSTISASYARNS